MLTLDLLLAVLRGLPPAYLSHLESPWRLFCGRIQQALRQGHPPLDALQLALEQASLQEVQQISKAIGEANGVMSLSDLSHRQKQALAALRYENVASLSHLSRVLNWDRSHTYHRLAVLVEKGYALKFYGDKGPHYFAVYEPQDASMKSQAFQLVQDFVERRRSRTAEAIRQARATIATRATTATHATSATPHHPVALRASRKIYSLADLRPAEINDS